MEALDEGLAEPAETESVDSCLMDFGALADACEEEARPRKPAGTINRLLSSVFGRKERKKARRATVDRAPYRPRAADLLQSLVQSSSADAAARLPVLRGLAAKLEELFKDLVAAGDRGPSVQALGEAVLRLHALMSQSSPAEAEILDVWARVENSLQRWLAVGETTESPRREGFWK